MVTILKDKDKPCRFEANKRGSCKHKPCKYSHNISKFSTAELNRLRNGSSSNHSSSSSSHHHQSHRRTVDLSNQLVKSTYTYEETRKMVADACTDEYSFKSARAAEVFVSALLCGEAWDDKEEATAVFVTLTDNVNGQRRIQDILTWSSISRSAGSGLTSLSFQRTFIGVLKYMSSDTVLRSTMKYMINFLYAALHGCMDTVCNVLREHLRPMLEARSIADTYLSEIRATTLPFVPDSFGEIFKILSAVFSQYLGSYKDAPLRHPYMLSMLEELADIYEAWVPLVKSGQFADSMTSMPESNQDWIFRHLKVDLARILTMCDIKHTIVNSTTTSASEAQAAQARAVVSQLAMRYDPPGMLRENGARHDNDSPHIQDIAILPTHLELTSQEEPYLPANLIGSPHHLPPGSADRELDVHFRLLREDLIAPFREITGLVLDHLSQDRSGRVGSPQLRDILRNRGGRYRSSGAEQGSDFNVFTSVRPSSLTFIDSCIAVFSAATPPGEARSHDLGQRRRYWRNATKRRTLVSGTLICLVWMPSRSSKPRFFIGEIRSREEDFANPGHDFFDIKITFVDPAVAIIIKDYLKEGRDAHPDSAHILFEPSPGIIYATTAPILKQLQKTDPSRLPFADYIARSNAFSLKDAEIAPPAFAVKPGFTWNLTCLLRQDCIDAGQNLRLNVNDIDSIDNAREQLKESSVLDPSQVDCIMDALTQEFSLVQGPPGTGKSYIGGKLVQVLHANAIKPVLVVAYTNHALDVFLHTALKVTDKLVRLGSRSGDEVIASLNMEELLRAQPKQPYEMRRNYAQQKEIRDKAAKECQSMIALLKSQNLSVDNFLRVVERRNRSLAAKFQNAPQYITAAFSYSDSAGLAWTTVGKKNQPARHTFAGKHERAQLFNFWLDAGDLHLYGDALHADRAPPASPSGVYEETEGSDGESDTASSVATGNIWEELKRRGARAHLSSIESSEGDEGYKEEVLEPDEGVHVKEARIDVLSIFPAAYELPSGNLSPMEILEDVENPWLLSPRERQALMDYVTALATDNADSKFGTAEAKFREANEKLGQLREQGRAALLKNADIIGCTTNGAAKYASILSAVAPRALILEEAGQITEGHTLAALCPSIDMVTFIGDPLQLRPAVSSYNLSMDSKSGKILGLDKSVMERLSGEAEFKMTSLLQQRRMHPSISTLVRPLYPKLLNHPSTEDHPNVKGFNLPSHVYFLNHGHREESKDLSSKANVWEAEMVRDIVLHLVKNGYDKVGDLAIVTGYLGQLNMIRSLLQGRVEVIVDERDETGDDLPEVRHVQLDKQVLIRTVDAFQGEEARIIILSLVRNSGAGSITSGEDVLPNFRPSIGFLRSPNRTNVALSRAREGMIILGEAAAMRASELWRSAIDELEERGAVGDRLPLRCEAHPDCSMFANNPGDIQRLSPDGGCLHPCDIQLPCGHVCGFKCHPLGNDPKHLLTKCKEKCTRLLTCGHPCEKACYETCSEKACEEIVKNVELKCGHILATLACGKSKDLSSIKCQVKVERQLLSCEHVKSMPCWQDPSEVKCLKRCGGQLACCSSKCTAECSTCQHLSSGQTTKLRQTAALTNANDEDNCKAASSRIERKQHASHPCDRTLYCQHNCTDACSKSHSCGICKNPAYVVCEHQKSSTFCGHLSAPCQAFPCSTRCEHREPCQLLCAFPCSIPPCSTRCTQSLQCGHICVSLCGEACFCFECASQEQKDSEVDLFCGRTMAEVVADGDEALIQLPCKHVYAVESLDGHLDMKDFYDLDQDGTPAKRKEVLPSDFFAMKQCPACKKVVTNTARYAAILKRAFLDLQERNSFLKSEAALSAIAKALAFIPRASSSNPPAIKWPKVEHMKSLNNRIVKNTNGSLRIPGLPTIATPLPDVEKVFKLVLPPNLLDAWVKHTRSLTSLHRQLEKHLHQRPPHKAAYDAAFVMAYRKEQERCRKIKNPPRDIEIWCRREARKLVGMPPPRADERSNIEAVWLILDIRARLHEISNDMFQVLVAARNGQDQIWLWREYQQYLIDASIRDCNTMIKACVDTQAPRMLSDSIVHLLHFHFLFVKHKSQGFRGSPPSIRQEVIQRPDGYYTQSLEEVEMHVEILQQLQGSMTTDIANAKQASDYIAKIIAKRDELGEAVEALQKQLLSDTWHDVITEEEKLMVLKVMLRDDFSSASGHSFRCPNGHPFFIGECGGAMEISKCPECGAPIGGTHHDLIADN